LGTGITYTATPSDKMDELLDGEYFICDLHDQGEKMKARCVFHGVQVDEKFIVGPITLRPLAPDDHFPKNIRLDFQHSVLELNYIGRKGVSSIHVEPMWIQEAAFKSIQLLVNNWSGISLIYHFNEDNEEAGVCGSARFQTADTDPPQQRGVLQVTDDNKGLFRRIFGASTGDLKHAIDRFSRACTEVKTESVLDFIIALEGTLGYGLENEIAHRLAARGAFLLGDPSKREAYYQIFKGLNNIRSRIAHGATATGKVSGKFIEAIKRLGYWRGDWSRQFDESRVRHIADVARQITREVLIAFVRAPELLDKDNLLKIELGLWSPN
jgi:hypothetical protein